MNSVSVRELRQNHSRYLVKVKEGESFVVTERGQFKPPLWGQCRLPFSPPAGPPFSDEILDELREERP